MTIFGSIDSKDTIHNSMELPFNAPKKPITDLNTHKKREKTHTHKNKLSEQWKEKTDSENGAVKLHFGDKALHQKDDTAKAYHGKREGPSTAVMMSAHPHPEHNDSRC